MFEFIEQYAPEITLAITFISINAPFLIKRVIDNKNILSQFGNIKSTVDGVVKKDMTFNDGLVKVTKSVDVIKQDITSIAEETHATLKEFQESEFTQRMMVGLDKLDELHKTIQNKDLTIMYLQETIKKIEKQLGVMENERKL